MNVRNRFTRLLAATLICSGLTFAGAMTTAAPCQAQDGGRQVAERTFRDNQAAQERAEGGTITVVYDESDDADYQRIAAALAESGSYEELAALLSEVFILPTDLVIRFTELGEANAYWDPNSNEITVGYELIYTYSQIFEVDENDPDALKQEYIDAAYFTVFHEVGHALVALFEIPITGREEDAVDEFATIALLAMDNQQAENALIAGIEQFYADAQEYDDISELPFADEHSLDKQRFYQVLILVHGSNPERYSGLVGGEYLPQDKAETSESEYARKSAVWDVLLAPHVR